ncbi:hypothetical protein BKA80DRAFT_263327 [Phyllosticta citrichinensis]
MAFFSALSSKVSAKGFSPPVFFSDLPSADSAVIVVRQSLQMTLSLPIVWHFFDDRATNLQQCSSVRCRCPSDSTDLSLVSSCIRFRQVTTQLLLLRDTLMLLHHHGSAFAFFLLLSLNNRLAAWSFGLHTPPTGRIGHNGRRAYRRAYR